MSALSAHTVTFGGRRVRMGRLSGPFRLASVLLDDLRRWRCASVQLIHRGKGQALMHGLKIMRTAASVCAVVAFVTMEWPAHTLVTPRGTTVAEAAQIGQHIPVVPPQS